MQASWADRDGNFSKFKHKIINASGLSDAGAIHEENNEMANNSFLHPPIIKEVSDAQI